MSEAKEAAARKPAAEKTDAAPLLTAGNAQSSTHAGETAEIKRIIRPLEQRRIVLAHASGGSIGNIWIVTVPHGTLWEDVFDPVFFSNKAMEMKPGDMIQVLHDRWEYEGELRVQLTYVHGFGNQPNRVQVYQRSFQETNAPRRVVNPGDLKVMHMGPHLKWCLMRDGAADPVRSGFDSQADAERERRNSAASRNTPRA